MKNLKFRIIFILTIIGLKSHAQTYDLIYQKSDDSIICKIDSVTPKAIYFGLENRKTTIKTYIPMEKVENYEFHKVVVHREPKIKIDKSIELGLGFSTGLKTDFFEEPLTAFTLNGGMRFGIPSTKFYINPQGMVNMYRNSLGSYKENMDGIKLRFDLAYNIFSFEKPKTKIEAYAGPVFGFFNYYYSFENDNPLTFFEEEIERISLFTGSAWGFDMGLRFSFAPVFIDISYLYYAPEASFSSDYKEFLVSEQIEFKESFQLDLSQLNLVFGLSLAF